MPSLIEQIRIRIQDPKRITATNKNWPGQRRVFRPTTLSVVEAAENQLGFKLPPLLSQLYIQVANGGFGPGYGIYGLEGGYADPIPLPPGEIDKTKGGILTDWYFCYKGTDEPIPELDFDLISGGKSTLSSIQNPGQITGDGSISCCPSAIMVAGRSLALTVPKLAFPFITLMAKHAN